MVKKILNVIFLASFLLLIMPCQAVFLKAQVYRKKCAGDWHYVFCLGDWHGQSIHDTKHLDDIRKIFQSNPKETFVMYEGWGPNNKDFDAKKSPYSTNLLMSIGIAAEKNEVENFNLQFRATSGPFNTLTYRTQEDFDKDFLYWFNHTLNEIRSYRAPKTFKKVYHKAVEAEEEARDQLLKNHKDLSLLGTHLQDIRAIQKIVDIHEKKSLIILCAGLAHIDSSPYLDTLLPLLDFEKCFEQGFSKKEFLSRPLSSIGLTKIVLSHIATSLCCPFASPLSFGERIVDRMADENVLDVSSSFVQFSEQEQKKLLDDEQMPALIGLKN